MKNAINLENAYQAYILSYGNRNILNDYAKSLDMELETFLMLILKYINEHKSRSAYAIIFDRLDLLHDSALIIDFLNNIDYPFKELKNNLQEYILLYRPDMLFNEILVNELQRKLNIYQEYLNDQKKVSIYTTSTSYYNQVMQSFMDSDYSLKRFSFQTGIKILSFKNYMTKIKSIEPIFYQELIENIKLKEKIQKETMKDDVYTILNKIKELGDNFSIIDFLTLTNYSFEEITQAGDLILDPNDAKLLRINVSNFKKIKNYSANDIKNIFIDKLIINIDGNLIEMSLEDKEKIVSFLKEHDIPISSTSYRDATIRYYNNTLFASPSK